ncbi:MAG TPA: putative porin, partial [Puia sp.]|nr:putative porin [Puia sp.]
TRLGLKKNANVVANPFSTSITTGSFYSVGNFLFRQQYDIIGKKDSIVTDTTVIPLFYPRFRAEYTINYNTYHYRFVDQDPDSVFYTSYYNFVSTPDTIRLSDQWHQLINDLSLYQFPDAKNPQQFIKVGATIENLNGYFVAGSITQYNAIIHGEYRNRTKNQKWDVEAFGKFYVSGANAADYDAYISLKRQISKNLGSLQLGFHNVNRTPSFIFDKRSSYGFGNPNTFFGKENNTNLFGALELPKLRLILSGNYYLINNYTYFQNHYHPAQETNPFNVLQITLDKMFVVDRHWIWRLLLVAQQKAGASPINIPTLVTFSQLGYEGKLGFKNLVIDFGLEFRYFTAYKADGYSPPVGQFFVQNDTTIRQKLPDINAYVHFR